MYSGQSTFWWRVCPYSAQWHHRGSVQVQRFPTNVQQFESNLHCITVYKCQHGASPSYLADKLSQPADLRLDVVYVLPLHHRWLSAVCSCQLSVTEPFWSPQLEFGTVCHSMLRVPCHCRLFSTAAWRHISLSAATLDCTHHSYCHCRTHLSFLLLAYLLWYIWDLYMRCQNREAIAFFVCVDLVMIIVVITENISA